MRRYGSRFRKRRASRSRKGRIKRLRRARSRSKRSRSSRKYKAKRSGLMAVASDQFASKSAGTIKSFSGVNSKTLLTPIAVTFYPGDVGFFAKYGPYAGGTNIGVDESSTRIWWQCHTETHFSNPSSFPIHYCLYYCKARRQVSASELLVDDDGNPTTTSIQEVSYAGFLQTSVVARNGYAAASSLEANLAYTPFDNPLFCKLFKISKCVSGKLKAGGERRIALSSRWRPVNVNLEPPDALAYINAPMVLIQAWGTVAPNSAGNTAGVSTAQVSFYSIRKYKIKRVEDSRNVIYADYIPTGGAPVSYYNYGLNYLQTGLGTPTGMFMITESQMQPQTIP